MTDQTESTQAAYQWAVLQQGQLPLRPGRVVDRAAEHRCTSVLIWPEGEDPTGENALLTDPCFSTQGLAETAEVLSGRAGFLLNDVRRLFVTHPHHDHVPNLPAIDTASDFSLFEPGSDPRLPDFTAVPCPGHFPTLRSLVFHGAGGRRVWIVGDAVLCEEWLRAWEYYWPNGYGRAEIIQTWRSVATILSGADVVIPGHGPPLRVTALLLEDLLARFPRAERAADCPDVAEAIRRRLESLGGGYADQVASQVVGWARRGFVSVCQDQPGICNRQKARSSGPCLEAGATRPSRTR